MNLSDPVNRLTGVGQTYTKKLERLNIKTIADLLRHYPTYYQDFSRVSKIGLAEPESNVTIQGKVEKISNQYRGWRKSLQKAIINDKTGQVQVTWFNQPFLINSLKKATKISLSGKITSFGSLKTMTNPEFEVISATPTIHTGRIVGIYSETRGISSKWLRARIRVALKLPIKEFLPKRILTKEGFLGYQEALNKIHFPQKKTDYLSAQKRLAFDELFLPQLNAQIKKTAWQKNKLAFVIKPKNRELKRFISLLPFKLTSAQEQVTAEILADLNQKTAMNRLLCGDVGSGKTIIAIIASYAIYHNRLRTLVMAPTEILAKQHYQTFRQFLPPKVKIDLQTKSQKKRLTNPDILIGTHALLFNKQLPKNIGLAVIDEQHRFGVKQRSSLIRNNSQFFPHVLTMTATPIPRSVALVLHGNLELSFLDEMPQNRKPVKTWLIPNKKRADAYFWIKKQINKNQAQVFIIYPLIEKSNQEMMKNIRAAKAEYKKLKENTFANFSVGLIHGRIKPDQKDKIVNSFAKGEIDILVATSIVEVGLDIPGATIMIIEGANRFGLAQLHQLRGRIGRNDQPAYCFLFTPNKIDQKGYRRLKILEKTSLGVELAKLDLEERGPGEIFGTAQHGFLKFKLASLADYHLVEKTQKWAEELVKNNQLTPSLKKRLKEDKISQVEPN
ncbi:MAG: ATP-dependent DNA helicase RecG [Candidatus Shapirobacteria bacterium]|nr:ATP-dependent DNA helicase RecG [Candidatus Shapirobacteria bacterium]